MTLLKKLEPMAKEMGIKIRYKDESKLMWFLGKVFFFNKKFMTRYVTTVGKIVYYPSRKWAENEGKAGMVLAHEMVHVEDNIKYSLPVMTVVYVFPQILAVLAIFAFWNIWFLFFLLALLPFPAPGRKWSEVNGYTMTMAVRHWLGDPLEKVPEYIVRTFTGSGYYYMWPFEKRIRWELEQRRTLIKCGKYEENFELANSIKELM